MIEAVTVVNYLGRQLRMELRNPEESGFLIRDITGLGPVQATINTTEIMSTNGAVFNSSRLSSRNIVLDIQFMWAKTIEEARLASYQWFRIGKPLRLIFETDARTIYTDGYVESNEPEIFSDQEATQISVICPDPYFYEYNDGQSERVDFQSVESAFTFPFSNDSLVEKKIIFGRILKNMRRLVNYEGDSEIGITMHIQATGEASGIIGLYNLTTNESIKFDTDILYMTTGSKIVAGDILTIDTRKGHKSAILDRGSKKINVLHCLTPDTDWMTLKSGDNELYFAASVGGNMLEVTVDYLPAYEGV